MRQIGVLDIIFAIVVVGFILLVASFLPETTRTGTVVRADCNGGFLAGSYVSIRYGAAVIVYGTHNTRTCIIFSEHLGDSVSLTEYLLNPTSGIQHYAFADGTVGP